MQATSMRILSLLLMAGFSPVFARAAEEDTPKPPELKVLEPLVGKWNWESVSKVAAWTPKETRAAGVLTREWVLSGRFVQEKSRQSEPDATDSLVLFSYDSSKKAYRCWLFNSKGHIIETSGQWDEASKSLNCGADLGNGLTNTTSLQFIDNDTHKWRAIVRDRQGKVYFDGEGTCRRQK